MISFVGIAGWIRRIHAQCYTVETNGRKDEPFKRRMKNIVKKIMIPVKKVKKNMAIFVLKNMHCKGSETQTLSLTALNNKMRKR